MSLLQFGTLVSRSMDYCFYQGIPHNWQQSVWLVLILFLCFLYLHICQSHIRVGILQEKNYFVIEFLQYLLVFHKSFFLYVVHLRAVNNNTRFLYSDIQTATHFMINSVKGKYQGCKCNSLANCTHCFAVGLYGEAGSSDSSKILQVVHT